MLGGERLGTLVLERADGDHRQARIDLDAGDGIARTGAEERLLKIGMRDAFDSAGEARAELDPGGAHFEIARNRLAAPDAPGDEDQMVRAQFGEHFLRQHAGRNRADMAARFHPLDHERIGAGPQ